MGRKPIARRRRLGSLTSGDRWRRGVLGLREVDELKEAERM